MPIRTPEQQALYQRRASTVEPPRDIVGGMDDFIHGAKQLGAGVVSNLSSSPQAIEDLGAIGHIIPNIAYKAAAIPGAIKTGYDIWKGNEIDTESALIKPLHYAASGDRRAEEILHTTPPRNTGDTFLRMTGELLGAPQTAVTKLATRGVTKAVTTPVKGAINAVKPVTPIKKVSDAAVAITFPGLQSKSLVGAIAETGVAGTIGDVTGEFVNPEYESGIYERGWEQAEEARRGVEAVDAMSQPKYLTPQTAITQRQSPGELQRDALRTRRQGLVTTGLPEETAEFQGKMTTEADTGFKHKKLAALAVGVGVMFGGAAVRKQITAHTLKQKDSLSQLTRSSESSRIPTAELQDAEGRKLITNSFDADPNGILTKGDIKKAQFVDWTSPLKRFVNEARQAGSITIQQAHKLKNDITLKIDKRAITSRISETAKSGKFTSSNMGEMDGGHVPLTHLLARQAQLKVGDQATLADMRVLGTKWDDLKRLNKERAADKRFTKSKPKKAIWGDTKGVNYTEWSIARKYNQLRRDNPDLASMLDDEYLFFKDANRMMFRNGDISAAAYKDRAAHSSHYVPTRRHQELSYTDPSQPRLPVDDINTIKPGEGVDPITLYPEYLARKTDFTVRNQARGDFLEFLLEQKLPTFNNVDVVSKLSGKQLKNINPNKLPDDVVRVTRQGKFQYYRVNDKYLVRVLDENPQWADNHMGATMKFMHGVARVKKAVTTGVASTFAPYSAIFDTGAGALAHNKDLNIGALSKHGAALSAFDPSVMLNPLTGSYRNIHAKMSAAIAQRADAAIWRDSFLVDLVGGEENMAKISMKAQRTYLNSANRTHERFGGASAPLHDAADDAVPDALAAMSPKFARTHSEKIVLQANPLYRSLLDINNVIHSSNRVELTALNMPDRIPMAGKMQYTLKNGDVVERPFIGIADDSFDYDTLNRNVLEAGVNPY
ncbi:hypothetical protein DRQ25_11260, partial [Candidatus Fermentibacteria bacterium]